MPVREVLMIGNPKLREKSMELTDFQDELKMIETDLRDTLTFLQEKKKIGRAIAAPQIGYMKKVIYIQAPKYVQTMINPSIVSKGRETFRIWDSCFSFDTSFFVQVKRHKEITVKYHNRFGEVKIESFKNGIAELLQHEIDHLYGVLATDPVNDPKNITLRSEWEQRYK